MTAQHHVSTRTVDVQQNVPTSALTIANMRLTLLGFNKVALAT